MVAKARIWATEILSLTGQRDHYGQVNVADEERLQKKAGGHCDVNTWELDL